MTQQTAEQVSIHTDDGPMPAHLWLPPSGSGPALVLVQEIFGVSAYIRDRGRDLAELGYVVCAPEIYWRLPDAEIDESDPEVLAQAMSVVSRVDWPAAVRDVQAALRHVRGMTEVTGGVGLIGFCFGGADAFIPDETIERVREAVTRHGAQFETYEGANHAFDNPMPAFHHPQASAAAWQATTRFLNHHLPT